MVLTWNIFAIIGIISSVVIVIAMIIMLYFLIKNKIRELKLKKQKNSETRIGYGKEDKGPKYRPPFFDGG